MGRDVLKYFILREFSFGSDGNFTIDKLVQRYNSDLVNDLGNLVSRTLSMIEKYFDGIIPEPNEYNDLDKEVLEQIKISSDKFYKQMDDFKFNFALEDVFVLIRRANKYIDETEPWKLAKEDTERLKTVLYVLCECIVAAAELLSPVLEDTAKEIYSKFNLTDEIKVKPGLKVAKGKNLFDRADDDKIDEIINLNNDLAESRKIKTAADTKAETKPQIEFSDFEKCDFRVGLVKSIENHPNADKLYVLKVDIGGEERTIVSGLKDHYKPEEIVGKKLAMIVNLKPVNLRGVESNGMILAAESGDTLSLLRADRDIDPGAKIR